MTAAPEIAMIDNAPEEETRAAWHNRLTEIGKREGFFETLGDEHSALFAKRGKTLVVTFDDLDHVHERGENRMPWGFDYTGSRGWSVLGMMAHDWTWYRDEAVFDFFDRLKNEKFFDQFDRVVFYGASMGAYAACVFSSAAPGATVVAISPQATLDREITPWETRYKKAWRRNYKNRYGFAPDLVQSAEQVYIFNDPTAPLDTMHAALFQKGNLTKLRCRFMGKGIAPFWVNMGVFNPVVEGGIESTLTRHEFYQLMRKRHEAPRYQREVLARLVQQNRHALTVRYCKAILSMRRAPVFRNEMNRALQILGRTS
jgi:hypothetical protein